MHVMVPECQTSGDGDWPQALACTRLRDTTVHSHVAIWTSVLPVWSRHGVGQAASQCNSCITGEMCSRRPLRVINLAAAFCTDCSRWSKLSVTPYKTELQYSRRLEMNACTIVFAASRDKDCSMSLICSRWWYAERQTDATWSAVSDNAEVACWADDADSRRQDWCLMNREFVDVVPGAEPQDLCLAGV